MLNNERKERRKEIISQHDYLTWSNDFAVFYILCLLWHWIELLACYIFLLKQIFHTAFHCTTHTLHTTKIKGSKGGQQDTKYSEELTVKDMNSTFLTIEIRFILLFSSQKIIITWFQFISCVFKKIVCCFLLLLALFFFTVLR